MALTGIHSHLKLCEGAFRSDLCAAALTEPAG